MSAPTTTEADDVAIWRRVSDELPTTEVPLGQRDVLFCRPGWATAVLGLFTWRGPSASLRPGEPLYEWAELDLESGRFVIFADSSAPDEQQPTLWLPLPRPPQR